MLIIIEVLSLQMEKGLSVRQNMSISYIRDLLKGHKNGSNDEKSFKSFNLSQFARI